MKHQLGLLISGVVLASAASASPPSDHAPTLSAPVTPAEKAQTPKSFEPDDAVLRVSGSPDGKTIFLVGKLDPGSYLKFRRVAVGLPKANTVFLASPGGLVLEGYLIGTLVRERKMATYVDAWCASSCTQIFIAGADRIVTPTAKVGFHESYKVDENGEASAYDAGAKSKNALPRASYLRSGIATDFVDKALGTSYKDMWYPSFDEMEKAKVITRKAAATELRPHFVLGMTRAALEAELLKRPLWQTVQQREPALYETAVDIAWRHGQAGMKAEIVPIAAQSEVSEKLMQRLATAPDDVVDGMLALVNDQIQSTRATDVERCASMGIGAARDDKNVPDRAYLEREETLMLGILNGPPIAKPLTEAQARKKILPVYFKVFREGYPPSHENAKTPAFQCGMMASLFGNIAKMPRKNRIITLRSLMIFGKSVEDEPVAAAQSK
jgi:hypothetical protein